MCRIIELTNGSRFRLDNDRVKPFLRELMRVGVVTRPRGRGLGVGINWRSSEVTGLIWSNERSNTW